MKTIEPFRNVVTFSSVKGPNKWAHGQTWRDSTIHKLYINHVGGRAQRAPSVTKSLLLTQIWNHHFLAPKKYFPNTKLIFVGHTVPILGADGWSNDKPQLLIESFRFDSSSKKFGSYSIVTILYRLAHIFFGPPLKVLRLEERPKDMGQPLSNSLISDLVPIVSTQSVRYINIY